MHRLLQEVEAASNAAPRPKLDVTRTDVGSATWLHAPCGTVVRCELQIDPSTRLIVDARFKGALCVLATGYGVVLARELVGQHEASIDEAFFRAAFSDDEVPSDKEHCHLPVVNACLGALQSWDSKQTGGDGVLLEPRGGLHALAPSSVVFGWFTQGALEQARARTETDPEVAADLRALFGEAPGTEDASRYRRALALREVISPTASFDVLDPQFRVWLQHWRTDLFEGPASAELLDPVFVRREALGSPFPQAQPGLIEFGNDGPDTWQAIMVEGLRSLAQVEPMLPADARLVVVETPRRLSRSGILSATSRLA
jgi:NifU-like protein involved in Fe-S cluster formation